MIDRVHFENFKSLQDVTLHLERLTALVGPNGCGKSSVLQGMHLLSLTGVKSPTDRATEDEIPRMRSEGYGLASTLAWMNVADDAGLAELTHDLRDLVPGVKRIKTCRERIATRRPEKFDAGGQPAWQLVDDTAIEDRFAIEFDDGFEVSANLLGEGTVLALGLLTKLHGPVRPRLFLLDDIDRGLHPTAQFKLVQVLRKRMALDPEMQIVCTTHSPYLLDLFEPAEVRVLALDAKRRTHVRSLTEHPEFGNWKFGTQTGELWAALGEEWVLAAATG
jgi:predicted ATPase